MNSRETQELNQLLDTAQTLRWQIGSDFHEKVMEAT